MVLSFAGKNAEKIGENGVLWAVSSMTPCTNGLLRGQIRKKNGESSTTYVDTQIAPRNRGSLPD